MVRILNVAEKNDAAKNISEIMSHGKYKRRDGFSKYNKIYEFEHTIKGQRSKMVMTSVSGHLLNYEFTGSYKHWHSCNPLTLFDAPVKKVCLPDYQNIKKTLEAEAKLAKILIIWTDCDREGENIGFEIIGVCKKVNPNLIVYRAKFSEITSQSITRASQTLAQPDENISTAVDVRQELDLRIGAAFTRFQTLRLQKAFPQHLQEALISYGSCQFPTLGFVVERYKQINAFIEEPFWKIKAFHRTEDGNIEFLWKRVRLFDHTACLVFYHICSENPTATVVDVQTKHKSKWRPLPLDTVEFEKLVSRKLHINAKEAMKIAEKLYTQGFISYPRTETNIFPKELDLRPLVQFQTQDQQWGGFAARILERGPNPRRGTKSDQAHPPIHPTKYTSSLQGNEKVIYEFIVRHFLACCDQDAEGNETIVEIDISHERFVAHGLIITARNYLEVYPYDKWSGKLLPLYEIAQTIDDISLEMIDGETSPPPLLTEADLIALMEKHGIGTDATHADHIETIKQRMYVGLTNNKFVPGELGMGLVEGYDSMGFAMSKPHLRAELEANLKRISEGTKDPKVVLAEQIKKYQDVFIKAVAQACKLDSALSHYFGNATDVAANDYQTSLPPVITKCSLCGSDLVLKTKKDGTSYYISCMNYPECKAVVWLPEFVETITVEDNFCNLCEAPLIKKLKMTFKKGTLQPLYPNNYTACLGGCEPNFLEALNVRSLRFVKKDSTTSQPKLFSSRTSSQTSNLPSFLVERRNSCSNSTINRTNSSSSPVQPFRSNENLVNNKITCNCGENAVMFTVKKDGPNQGRQFYSCGKPQNTKCGFFLWAENNLQQLQQPVRRNNQNFPNLEDVEIENRNIQSPVVNCQCGIPAKRLTVQKEGPNQGRIFFACSKNRSEQCRFFQWDDQVETNTYDKVKDKDNRNQNHRKRNLSNPSTPSKKRKCGICGEEGHNRKTCPNKNR